MYKWLEWAHITRFVKWSGGHDFAETMLEVYQQPAKKDFDFRLGQTVRVRKSLDIDTYYIRNLLGAKGTVERRYTTGLHKENKYEIKFENGRIETFDESELDGRYAKKAV